MLIFACLLFLFGLFTLTSPPPKWYFWAACLVLLGLFFPLAFAILIVILIIRGMIWLYRVTMS